MNIFQDIDTVFNGVKQNSEAKDLLKLLKNEGTIIKVQEQGNCLMLEYEGNPSDLSCITKELYHTYNLIVKGFDSKPTFGVDKVRLWLISIDDI